jgi:MFS family permease
MDRAKITKGQWRAFVAAWLGWAFDGLDGYLYVLVATKFVTQLMATETAGLTPEAAKALVTSRASLIAGVFLIGWACGGLFFGRIGDKLGRSRTLSLTILTYAIFTGLTFFAQTWWHLLILRFVAALGIGGEWAAGSSLVSETWHVKHRAWASATLQSGYMVGMLLAAFTTLWLKDFEPRYVFLVGVIPAFATFWIRKSVGEPEEWQGAAEKAKHPSVMELFKPGVRATTLLTLGLTSIALTTVWAFLYFAPQQIQAMGTAAHMEKTAITALIFSITVSFTLWNIAGNFLANYLAAFTSFRFAFAVLMLGAFITFFFGFGTTRSLDEIGMWLNVGALFSLGIFGIFPLYIPPLFPVLLRTTGAGFSYNFGRIIAGSTLIYLGLTAAHIEPAKALYSVSFLYILGIIISLFMPELPKPGDEPEAAPAL